MTPTHDARLHALQDWLASLPAALSLQPDSLRPASADARQGGPGHPASCFWGVPNLGLIEAQRRTR